MRLPRGTPATITALVALVLVGTGSAVAARLITSKQIADGTIQLKDISLKARASLDGGRGPQGAPGPAGPQGERGAHGASGERGERGASAEPAALATALPSTPVDGQEVNYLADAGRGVVWRLRYRAASASPYKWELIGGAALFHSVDATGQTGSGGYTNLATAGPVIAIPLSGDYVISHGFAGYNDTAVGWINWMSYAIGTTAATDADSVSTGNNPASGSIYSVSTTRLKTALPAVALTAKYRSQNGTATFQRRWMSATPVRVS